jgi:hypothetical protein
MALKDWPAERPTVMKVLEKEEEEFISGEIPLRIWHATTKRSCQRIR